MAFSNSLRQIMNNVIQTTFAGKNPFTHRKPKEVDITTLRISTDQPKKRIARFYKYDSLFKELEIGKSLSCKSEDCDKVAQALRSYVKRCDKPWAIKGQAYYTKTTGRIFVLEKK
jgi:cobalamin biosynthesis Co2+ chelatase CbiK